MQEVVNRFQAMNNELGSLQNKINEFEADFSEHQLVIEVRSSVWEGGCPRLPGDGCFWLAARLTYSAGLAGHGAHGAGAQGLPSHRWGARRAHGRGGPSGRQEEQGKPVPDDHHAQVSPRRAGPQREPPSTLQLEKIGRAPLSFGDASCSRIRTRCCLQEGGGEEAEGGGRVPAEVQPQDGAGLGGGCGRGGGV